MAATDHPTWQSFRPTIEPWWRVAWNRSAPALASWFTLSAAATMLLWPAFWNRYPIVFADTGTYLSQAIERYAGWDRPVFYSLGILPLHMLSSLWPITIAQAYLTAWLIRKTCRHFAPALAARAFLPLIAALSLATWLPYLVSEVMPDLFTPLLVLLLALPSPDLVAIALAAFAIATQLSRLPLSLALIATLALLRRLHRKFPVMAGEGLPSTPSSVSPTARRGWHPSARQDRGPLRLLLAPALAVLALCTVNLAAHHRFAVSPFGNIFYLARLLYDGPGQVALAKTCPQSGWRLCAAPLPANSDDFLWHPDSPLYRDGGPKHLTAEANAIIRTAIALDPAGVAETAMENAFRQLTHFASGDGLTPWPHEVTPVLQRHFPPEETARYQSARQQSNDLAVPPILATLHWLTALAGTLACLFLLPRRRTRALLAAVLVALLVNAATTGILSGPHDRYQARLMWLPPFAAIVALSPLNRRYHHPPVVVGGGRPSTTYGAASEKSMDGPPQRTAARTEPPPPPPPRA
jgi:hypothetical protein